MDSSDSDVELIRRMATGEAAAMRTFYDRHKAMVGRLARSGGLNDVDGRDLVQEAFLRVWQSAGSYRGSAPPTAWLRGIVRHLIADHIDDAVRARGVFAAPRAADEDDAPLPEAMSPEPGPERLLELSRAKRCISECLAKLSALHREVLALRVCGAELKEQNVAQLLGVPIGTVKSRTSVALRALSACVVRCSGESHG